MTTLSKEHKEKIGHYIHRYSDRLKTELSDEGWAKERKERSDYLQTVLSEEDLDQLTEKQLAKIIKDLWASGFWTNKDYVVNKIIQGNGIDKIRKQLKSLIYGKNPLKDRFDLFMENIKGLGPSSVTEILTFVNPDKYCIWNDKPKNVLPIFGMETLLPDRVFKYQIRGNDYVQCTHVLDLVRHELEAHGFKGADFLDVDILMWLLFTEVVRREPKIPRKKPPKVPGIDVRKLGHYDIMGILLELGNLLGYDTYSADPSKKSDFLGRNLADIASLKEIPGFTFKDTLEVVKNIDVIWFKDAEYPERCFEVEHTTGVTLGLLRLYQISPLKGIDFYVVAPLEVLPRFEKEINRKPFKEIRNRYIFKSYEDVAEFYQEAKRYWEIRRKFLESK